jgi:hypothetical protein
MAIARANQTTEKQKERREKDSRNKVVARANQTTEKQQESQGIR